MKMLPAAGAGALSLMSVAAPAADIGFQSRFEIGLLWYELEIGGLMITDVLDDGSASSLQQESHKVADQLPFSGLGGTLIIDRFALATRRLPLLF